MQRRPRRSLRWNWPAESWNWYWRATPNLLWRGRCTRHHPRYPRQRGIGEESGQVVRELLGDGEGAKARPIVANLASEIVIETANLPMATYPAAIKSAARSSTAGKIDDARRNCPSTEHAGGDLGRLSSARAKAAMAKACWPRPTSAMPSRTRSSSTLLSSARRSRWRRSWVMARRRISKPIFDQVKSIEQKGWRQKRQGMV